MGTTIFISYSHSDSFYRTELEKHLSVMRDNGKIKDWSDGQILPGDKWDHEINKNLESAKIILLLVSPDFLASKYIKQIELHNALERDKKKECRVIPIILRYCNWESSVISGFHAIPSQNGRIVPIKAWQDQDEAFNVVTNEIERILNNLVIANGESEISGLKIKPVSPINKTKDYSRKDIEWSELFPKSIILDRHYAYMLTAFCNENKPEDKYNFSTKYRDLFEAITFCLFFFDKILLEQHHVSSLAWNLSESESVIFKNIFESFSFDNEYLNPYENMLLKDMIKLDSLNPDLKVILDEYYSKKSIKPNKYSDIINYVNNCIFYAEKNNTSICPIPSRIPIYEYKFNGNNKFRISQTTRSFINDSIEVLIPEITFYSLEELYSLKTNTSFINFKNKMWELSISHLKSTNARTPLASVTEEFTNANFQLISELQFKDFKKGQLFMTGQNSIPVNQEINLPIQLEEKLIKNKFNWLFFIYDTKANSPRK